MSAAAVLTPCSSASFSSADNSHVFSCTKQHTTFSSYSTFPASNFLSSPCTKINSITNKRNITLLSEEFNSSRSSEESNNNNMDTSEEKALNNFFSLHRHKRLRHYYSGVCTCVSPLTKKSNKVSSISSDCPFQENCDNDEKKSNIIANDNNHFFDLKKIADNYVRKEEKCMRCFGLLVNNNNDEAIKEKFLPHFYALEARKDGDKEEKNSYESNEVVNISEENILQKANVNRDEGAFENNEVITLNNIKMSQSFHKNVDLLQAEFPYLQQVLIISLLEATNNDLLNCRELLSNLIKLKSNEKSKHRKENEENFNMIENKNKCNKNLQNICSINDTSNELKNENQDDTNAKFIQGLLSNCSESIVYSMQTAHSMDQAKHTLIIYLKELSNAIWSVFEEKSNRNLEKMKSEIKTHLNRIESVLAEKQILAKAVKLQYEKIERLQLSVADKDNTINELATHLKEVKEENKKCKLAIASYVYQMQNSEPYFDSFNLFNKRFPPDVY